MSNQNINNNVNNDFLNKKREINKIFLPSNQIEFFLCNKCNLKNEKSNVFSCQKLLQF